MLLRIRTCSGRAIGNFATAVLIAIAGASGGQFSTRQSFDLEKSLRDHPRLGIGLLRKSAINHEYAPSLHLSPARSRSIAQHNTR